MRATIHGMGKNKKPVFSKRLNNLHFVIYTLDGVNKISQKNDREYFLWFQICQVTSII
jgi:hypothetical protein